MTDYTDLIERLRGNDMPWSVKDAADALEAQARRIAELEDKLEDEEYVSKDTDEMFNEVRDENIELRARIDQLKAAMKPFADCGVWDGYKDEEVFKLGFKIADLRAARAAYRGEKE